MQITTKDIKLFNKLLNITKLEYSKRKIDIHYNKYLVSAMIVNKKLYSYGFNNYDKTHTKTIQSKHYANVTPLHAEIDAINKWNYNWDLSKATMYICALSMAGKFCKSSKPCESCFTIIEKNKISRIVYYTLENDTFSLHSELII